MYPDYEVKSNKRYSYPPKRNSYESDVKNGYYDEDEDMYDDEYDDTYYNDDDYLDMEDICKTTDYTGMMIWGTDFDDNF